LALFASLANSELVTFIIIAPQIGDIRCMIVMGIAVGICTLFISGVFIPPFRTQLRRAVENKKSTHKTENAHQAKRSEENGK